MRVCKLQSCGSIGENLLRCEGCKEVRYCCKEHQKEDWKSHKKSCKFANGNPESVWIEIPAGGNLGVSFRTKMIDHVFPKKEDGHRYLTKLDEEFRSRTSRPHSSPLAKSLGWDLEVYVSSKNNYLDDEGGFEQSHWEAERISLGHPPSDLESKVNGTANAVTRDLFSDHNRLEEVDGTVFVTGRSCQTGQPCNSQILGGMLSFLWYCEENDLGRGDINQLVNQYKSGTWSLPTYAPAMGFEGVDIYLTDVRRAGRVVRHA